MTQSDLDENGTCDADLVAAALGGDREAVAAIYDRHADRLHSMALHMLRDSDEAADVCGEVFLVAFQRLGQLREPSRLKSWLFAIARHEIYKRNRRAGRVQLVEEVEEMDRIAAAPSVDGETEDQIDPDELVRILRDASGGLDERDRMVMEMQLQGVDGDDLAAALGTTTSTSYQHVHRMKERLERSIGALLVARRGREDCQDLDRLLAAWDGHFSVLWRKRVARHIDRCDTCERRRSAVPAVLLGGAALAAPMVGASSVSAAPSQVRERVLRDAQVGAGGSGWRHDGFPPAGGRARRWSIAASAASVLLVAVAVGLFWLSGGDSGDEVLVGVDTASTVQLTPSSTTSTTEAPVSADEPAVAPATDAELAPLVPVPVPLPSQETLEPALQDTAAPPRTPPAPEPLPPAPPVAPTVRFLGGPGTVFHPTEGQASCGASVPFVVEASSATAVQLVWRGSGADGIIDLERNGLEWRAVLEVPSTVVGPLTVTAVGYAPGATGTSEQRSVPVAPCLVPG